MQATANFGSCERGAKATIHVVGHHLAVPPWLSLRVRQPLLVRRVPPRQVPTWWQKSRAGSAPAPRPQHWLGFWQPGGLEHVPRRPGCARLSEAPAPRLRDDHGHAARAGRPYRQPGQRWPLWLRRCAVDDGWERHLTRRDVPVARSEKRQHPRARPWRRTHDGPSLLPLLLARCTAPDALCVRSARSQALPNLDQCAPPRTHDDARGCTACACPFARQLESAGPSSRQLTDPRSAADLPSASKMSKPSFKMLARAATAERCAVARALRHSPTRVVWSRRVRHAGVASVSGRRSCHSRRRTVRRSR
jgi:hypothetical protein